MCSYVVIFTGFVSADSVSDERVFAVPSCDLLVCKVGKAAFENPACLMPFSAPSV